MRSRYYSPDLKRFVNADILAGDIKNSSTLNQYAYVEGNPISMVDPFGLCAEPGSSSKSSGNWWSKMTSGIGNYFSSWSFNDVGHTFLDGAGMIPVIGFAFDGTNALWYLAAGDMVNAGLSGTTLIPVVGEVAGGGKIGARVVSKAVSKSVKYSDKMVEATEIAVKNEDKIADIGKIADDVGKKSLKTDLHRPYVRKNVRAEVEANAPKTADGRFIDPNTRMPIEGKYDLGHKPGKEFWREKANAQSEGLTQKQFNDRMNNPDYYQIEDPVSNRSHLYEMPK